MVTVGKAVTILQVPLYFRLRITRPSNVSGIPRTVRSGTEGDAEILRKSWRLIYRKMQHIVYTQQHASRGLRGHIACVHSAMVTASRDRRHHSAPKANGSHFTLPLR